MRGEDSGVRTCAPRRASTTYSANNVWLMLMQPPEASRLAGFYTWKAVGRNVVKGAKGIKILAPCAYTVRDDEGDAVLDADGNARRMLRGFRVVHVFDVADTAGEPVPVVDAELLDDDTPSNLWDAIASQVLRAGLTLTRNDCRRANGRIDFADRTVRVLDELNGAQAAKTLAHERAHILLHDHPHNPRTRDHCEVEAESVAYIVLQAQGVETDSYSLPHVAGWSGGKAEVIADTAARALGTAAAAAELGLDSLSITHFPFEASWTSAADSVMQTAGSPPAWSATLQGLEQATGTEKERRRSAGDTASVERFEVGYTRWVLETKRNARFRNAWWRESSFAAVYSGEDWGSGSTGRSCRCRASRRSSAVSQWPTHTLRVPPRRRPRFTSSRSRSPGASMTTCT